MERHMMLEGTPFLIKVGFCVYDICISIVFVNITDTGKKAQVWKSTNFDAGLYDITGFSWDLIISIYL
jgi:hypothetical protein